MKRQYFIYFILIFFFLSCSKNRNFTIDKSIKIKVEEKIIETERFKNVNTFFIYENPLLIQLYSNDSLYLDSMNENRTDLFKSFYFWEGDTLNIDGGFGLFGSAGFNVKISGNNAQLFHMLSSDDFPTYSYTEKDSLIFRLEVPCKNTKIVLSEIPDKHQKQVIFGYVEFESEDYFAAEIDYQYDEKIKKIKNRANMKIYFKSGFIDISR